MHNNPTLYPPPYQLPLDELGAAIEAMIALYDAAAGDPDLESNGDDADGTGGEDDFCDHPNHYGAGCPIADNDSEHDGREVEHEL